MPFNTDIYEGCGSLLYCLAVWVNTITFGMGWTILLLGFCIVLFMATFNYGSNRAFGFASVAGIFGGMYLSILTLIPWWVSTIFFVVGAIGIVSMIVSER